jgi:hypothetical protein
MDHHAGSVLTKEDRKAHIYSTIGHKNKEKRRLATRNKRDFYKLAAALANPHIANDISSQEQDKISKKKTDEFFYSRLLDSGFQEKSHIFLAPYKNWCSLVQKKSLLVLTLKKWHSVASDNRLNITKFLPDQKNSINYCSLLFEQPKKNIIKNGIKFTIDEIKVLLSFIAKEVYTWMVSGIGEMLSYNAIDFHQKFISMINTSETGPFLSCGQMHGSTKLLLINKARLFWSYRLNMKSLQKISGADPAIRYFHAIILPCAPQQHREKIDILYWLIFDEEQKTLKGDFILPIPNTFIPSRFFYPRTFIEQLVQDKASDKKLLFADSSSITEILKIYLESIS